jgi:hypothetical protein
MNNSELDAIVKEAEKIAASDYSEHEPTARNHANLRNYRLELTANLSKRSET